MIRSKTNTSWLYRTRLLFTISISIIIVVVVVVINQCCVHGGQGTRDRKKWNTSQNVSIFLYDIQIFRFWSLKYLFTPRTFVTLKIEIPDVVLCDDAFPVVVVVVVSKIRFGANGYSVMDMFTSSLLLTNIPFRCSCCCRARCPVYDDDTDMMIDYGWLLLSFRCWNNHKPLLSRKRYSTC